MTGSGKTAAFLLPILHQLIDTPRGTTRALVLTPTRELAAQILEDLNDLAVHTPITAAAVYGGVGMGPQEHALPQRRGRHRRHARPAARSLPGPLRQVRRARVPGARRGRPDARHGIPARHPAHPAPHPRQAADALLQRHHAGADRRADARDAARPGHHQPGTASRRRPSASRRRSIRCAQELKAALFLALLAARRHARGAGLHAHQAPRQPADQAPGAATAIKAERIHGNRSQAQRTEALAGFKSGKYRVLVATDIAARGIDVEELGHVVNFDVPMVPDDYIHRVGRTARAEATGDAFTFVSPEEEGDLRAIERAIGKRLPRVTVPDFDYAAKPSVPARGAARRAHRGDPRQEGRGPRARQGQGGATRRPRDHAGPPVERATQAGGRVLGRLRPPRRRPLAPRSGGSR